MDSNKKQDVKSMALIALFAAALVVVGVFLGSSLRGDSGGTQATKERQIEELATSDQSGGPVGVVGVSDDRIRVVGFDVMQLKAGTFTQDCDLLYNPEENDAYFRFTLELPDGTVFFQSGLISPGQRLEHLELSRKLTAGTYPDAVLRYECFALEDQTPLNGATIKFRLEVI